MLSPQPTEPTMKPHSLTRKIILLPASKLTLKSLQKYQCDQSNRKVLTQQIDNLLPYEQFAIKSNPDQHHRSGLSDMEILEEEKMCAPPIFPIKPLIMEEERHEREHMERIRKLVGERFYWGKMGEVRGGMLEGYEGWQQGEVEKAFNRGKKVIKLKSRRYQSGLESDTKQLRTSRKTKDTRSLETRISKGISRFIQVTLATSNSPYGHDNTSAWLTPHKTKSQYQSVLMSSINQNKSTFSKTLGIKIVSHSLKRQATEPILSPGCFQIHKGTCCPNQGDVDPIDTRQGSQRSLPKPKHKPIKTITHIVQRKPKPIKLFKKKPTATSQSFTSLR